MGTILNQKASPLLSPKIGETGREWFIFYYKYNNKSMLQTNEIHWEMWLVIYVQSMWNTECHWILFKPLDGQIV